MVEITNQYIYMIYIYIYPIDIPLLSPVVRWYTTNFRRRNVNFSGPEGATPLGNGALAAEPGLAEASRRVLAGFAQAVDSINCMSLSEYVYIYISSSSSLSPSPSAPSPSPSPSSSSSFHHHHHHHHHHLTAKSLEFIKHITHKYVHQAKLHMIGKRKEGP